jgi:hypothetical protein
MDVLDTPPKNLIEFSPIFVTAPTQRCGTTLLQRLLNSSNKVVIFGEDTILSSVLPDILHATFRRLQFQEEEISQNREKFKNETKDFWSNGLLPESNELHEATLGYVKNLMETYEKSAEKLACKTWGSKFPLRMCGDMNLYARVLPNCRIIFIYRDLFEVAKSCKARKWLHNKQDIFNLAFQWKNNVTPFLGENSKRTLLLRYEELVSKPEETILKIEKFVGIEGIDRNVMKNKINTWRGSHVEGVSETGYIAPERLTSEERRLLREVAKESILRMGYSLS